MCHQLNSAQRMHEERKYEFKVITDHVSPKWLMSQNDLCGRLARWSMKLLGFNFSNKNRKASQHVVLDLLSRVHSEDMEEINRLVMDTCFLEELTDSIEIDLCSDAFLP